MATDHLPNVPALDDIAAELLALHALPDLDRVHALRALTHSIPVALQAHADAAVHAATRQDTQPTVAHRLGVKLPTIVAAVRRHRARTGQASGPGKPKREPVS